MNLSSLCTGNVSGSQKRLQWDCGGNEWTSRLQNLIKWLKLICKGEQALFSILKQLSFSHQNGNQSSTIKWINYEWYNSYTKYKPIKLFNSWTWYEYYACMLPQIFVFLAAGTFFLCSCTVITKYIMLTWIQDNATITFLTHDTLLWLKLKNHL